MTILHEEYRDRRIIPVDGRPHGNIRQWFGDAVGRWEGDTLVVDTTNFLDRTNYEWANIWTRPSETLHLVERFTQDQRGHDRIHDHRRGSGDVFETLDGGHSHLEAGRRHADLRVRVSRGKLRDAQSAERRSHRRGEGRTQSIARHEGSPMRTNLIVLLAGLAIVLPRRRCRAHHAFAAEFDANKPIKLRGTVDEDGMDQSAHAGSTST